MPNDRKESYKQERLIMAGKKVCQTKWKITSWRIAENLEAV
jgi:hypothetical protein